MKKTITFFNFGFIVANALWFHWAVASEPNIVTEDTFTKNYQTEQEASVYTEEGYAEELEDLGIKLHPGSEYLEGADGNELSLTHCKSLVYRTLKSLPEEPVSQLKHLTLYFSDTGRRGLGGGSTIILRCQNVTDAELVGVLVHEMGHITDTGVMGGSAHFGKSSYVDGSKPIYNNDASLDFYKLSFVDDETVKQTATRLDFVSGYAMTDPFEDFAESYAYYILHGTEFRTLAKSNKVLDKKYEYLKKRVFDGKEYFNGKEIRKGQERTRSYDVTVLPYDMTKFFTI